MDSNIGRNLMKIIDAIPVLDVETFDTLMTNQMNVILKILIKLNSCTCCIINLIIIKGFAYGILFV